jgi:hypothetical protein
VAAQLGLLRAAASTPRAVAVDLDTRRRIASDALPRRLRIELSRPVSGRSAARDDRALFTIPALPAGEYRVMPVADAPRGWLMLGINADQFALWTGPIPSPTQPIALRFPVMVRGLIVRGDEDARQVVRGLRLEPVSLRPAGAQLTRAVARRAVVHGETTVFFLDDHSFPEPEAFWVGGARSSAVLFQPRTAGGVQPFLLRNAPVENRVAIEAGAWRTGLQLAPGEERRLEVPIDPAHGAALVRFTVDSGFRPSDHDPSSRDGRFLGVWIKAE